MSVVCMYVIVSCVCSALQEQKKASDTLELELQEVVGFRNWTLILCESSECS